MIKNENVEGEPAYDETYRRGPVVMRGPMIPKDNTYANLLAPEESTDWLHADPWRVLRIQAEFVDGFGALAELGPAVTIFGSARTPKTDPAYKAARTVGRKIAQRGVAVITGGGPGIMEAANRGAASVNGKSVGLGIELPHEHGLNKYVNLGMDFRYFFVRLHQREHLEHFVERAKTSGKHDGARAVFDEHGLAHKEVTEVNAEVHIFVEPVLVRQFNAQAN